MRLLASTDIALRILMLLGRAPPETRMNVEQLASELGDLSRNHMHKIVQQLAGLRILATVRGAGGGVALAKAPADIRLGALVRELESDQAIVECFRADGGLCAIESGCRLRFMLRTAREAFYASLDAHTLADCIGGAPLAAIKPPPRPARRPRAS